MIPDALFYNLAASNLTEGGPPQVVFVFYGFSEVERTSFDFWRQMQPIPRLEMLVFNLKMQVRCTDTPRTVS